MEISENAQLLSNVVTVNVKHIFTEEELKQQSGLLAQAVKDQATEEDNKKQATAEFKTKIDKHKAEVKLYSGNINNGSHYVDKACELWLDFDTKTRMYKDKQSGEFVKADPFHASDYQKQIEFEETERAQQSQISENNSTGDFAEGDALDNVIKSKKTPKRASKAPAFKTIESEPDPFDDFEVPLD